MASLVFLLMCTHITARLHRCIQAPLTKSCVPHAEILAMLMITNRYTGIRLFIALTGNNSARVTLVCFYCFMFDLNLLFYRNTGLYHIEKIYFASAYYVWRTPGPGAAKTRAFPPGFQMIARQGNPKARVLFDCNGESACERDGENCKPIHTCKDKKQCFPTNRCSELEIRISFPACWDGKSLTSSNFMDHVAYGKGDWSTDQGDAYASECPDTHPVRIPEVHFYFRILDYEVNSSCVVAATIAISPLT